MRVDGRRAVRDGAEGVTGGAARVAGRVVGVATCCGVARRRDVRVRVRSRESDGESEVGGAKVGMVVIV